MADEFSLIHKTSFGYKRLEKIFRKNQGMILADLPHFCVLPLTNSVVSLEEKRRQTCNYFKS